MRQNLIDKVSRSYWIIGVFFVLLSLLHWFFPLTRKSVALAHTIFTFGNVLIFDYVCWRLIGKSLLTSLRDRHLWLLVRIIVIYSVIFEVYARWITQIWYWPFLDTKSYLVVFIPAAILYGFYLTEIYLGAKAILERIFGKVGQLKIFGRTQSIISQAFRLSGFSFLVIAVALVLRQINNLNLNLLLNANKPPLNPHSDFLGLLFGGFVFWIFLDLWEYRRYGSSMIIEALVTRKPIALIACLFSGLVGGISYEYFNLYAGLWRYTNIPFSEVVVGGIPIAVLLTWPIPIMIQISLFRLFLKRRIPWLS